MVLLYFRIDFLVLIMLFRKYLYKCVQRLIFQVILDIVKMRVYGVVFIFKYCYVYVIVVIMVNNVIDGLQFFEIFIVEEIKIGLQGI